MHSSLPKSTSSKPTFSKDFVVTIVNAETADLSWWLHPQQCVKDQAWCVSRYPEQCFDVAIAEQHAVTLATGVAIAGDKRCLLYSRYSYNIGTIN
ncbi:hypothetical protein OH492_05290 [Vibrio chagasii]|nr:hypothetical protein [Vibrio chagasii]